MKSVQTAEQNTIEVVDIERPVPGPKDVLVRIRACGICGTDVSFLHMGGIPFGPGGSIRCPPLRQPLRGQAHRQGRRLRAGPIGLGATIGMKLRGVEQVAVADVIPEAAQRAVFGAALSV